MHIAFVFLFLLLKLTCIEGRGVKRRENQKLILQLSSICILEFPEGIEIEYWCKTSSTMLNIVRGFISDNAHYAVSNKSFQSVFNIENSVSSSIEIIPKLMSKN